MKEIIINVDSYNENSIKTIEGDNLSEVYKIYILKNKRRIDLTNKIAIMAYVNEYGNKKSNILALNITNASQGEIELPITNVISSENGVYACQIAIYGENNSLEQTAPFSLIVENNIFSKISNSAINSSDFHILSEAIKTTNSYAKKLKEGTENIELQYAKKLNEKMNKDDVLSMANMGQDVKEAMTGGSVAVVGKNAILAENIVDNQVTPRKINSSRSTFSNAIVNLLNPNTITRKKYINNQGEEEITSSNNVYCSDFIEVYENKQYTLKKTLGFPGAWYDSNKKFISTLEANQNEITLVPPSNAKFLRWNGDDTTPIETTMIIFGSTKYPESYIAYSDYKEEFEFDWLKLNKYNFPSNKKILTLDNIEGVNLTFSDELVNLLNPSTIKEGIYINNAGEEAETSGSGVYCTNFIEVYPSKQYTFKKILGFPGAWYDENKKFISSLEEAGENREITLTAPSKAKYLRWNGDNTAPASNTMIVFGKEYPHKYFSCSNYKFSYKINGLNCNTSNKSENKFDDKLWASFGDSITWQDGKAYGSGQQVGEIARGYQTLIKEAIGLNYRNEGKSGYICEWMVETYKESIKDFDIASFFIGTNDFMMHVTLEDFKKHLTNLCEYISTKTPNVQVFFMTPLQRWGYQYEGKSTTMTNDEGVHLYQYADAMIEVCNSYGFPVVDLYRNSQLNKSNIKTFTRDGLHPIDKGYAKFANLVYDMIKKVCF
ncbi:MAG: GDSL-type esterase/lipase family protein [Clostridium perfringens]|nr:GDSL-type esterase/lipase family protein [Clostridium perfringens]